MFMASKPHRCVLALLLSGLAAPGAGAASLDNLCQPIVVGERTVESHARIVAAGNRVRPAGLVGPTGFDWPDTFLGVARRDDGQYLFFGSDGSCHSQCNRPRERDGSFTRTLGTLDDPLGTAAPLEVILPQNHTDLPPDVLYVGGGPVYRVPQGEIGAGTLLMVYHAERATYAPGYHYPDCDSSGFCNRQQTGIYSFLGLASSADDGLTWRDHGPIITANIPYAPQNYYDVGEGNLVLAPRKSTADARYLLVYFPDRISAAGKPDGILNSMAVARVAYDPLLLALSTETPLPAFHKYFAGTWDQPGVGGVSSNLLIDVPGLTDAPYYSMQMRWSVATHRLTGVFDDGHVVKYTDTTDGLHWSAATDLVPHIDQNNQVANYATAVGLGDDPMVLGQLFYVYYNFQQYYGANAGWPSAELRRMEIVCTATAAAEQ